MMKMKHYRACPRNSGECLCQGLPVREARRKMEGGWTIQINEWWDGNILAYILLFSFLEIL
jgi:hypothetical protein